jgi:hypothetical protein
MKTRTSNIRLRIAFAFVMAFSVFGTARALEIVADSFDYTSGSITAKNGGTGWADAWSSATGTFGDFVVVTGGSLT